MRCLTVRLINNIIPVVWYTGYVDAVYICRGGDNEELRYSIRSTEKNLPVSRIVVVGEPPSWYIGAAIHVKQLSQQKYVNAQNNLKAIASSSFISNEFVLMNDDFYTISEITSIPNYNGGSLRSKVERYMQQAPYSPYTKKLSNTYRYLVKTGISNPIDYELHVPMIMAKNGLARSIYPNILWRSVYGNRFNSLGDTINDVKVYSSSHLVDKSYDFRNGSLPFLSSEDASFEMLKHEVLGDMFSEPSSVELGGIPRHISFGAMNAGEGP